MTDFDDLDRLFHTATADLPAAQDARLIDRIAAAAKPRPPARPVWASLWRMLPVGIPALAAALLGLWLGAPDSDQITLIDQLVDSSSLLPGYSR